MVAPDQLGLVTMVLGSTSSRDSREYDFFPSLLKCSFLAAAALSFLESLLSTCADELASFGCMSGGARAILVAASKSADWSVVENFIFAKAERQ
jgi:hypothetical protein